MRQVRQTFGCGFPRCDLRGKIFSLLAFAGEMTCLRHLKILYSLELGVYYMDAQKILDAKGQAQANIFSVPASTTLSEFVKLACERNVGALLVTDKYGKPAGIVSERDILRQCNAGADFKKTSVGQIMSRELATVSPNDDMNAVMDLMIKRKVRHLPVVLDNKILGIITVRDLIQAMRKTDEEEMRKLVEYLQSTLVSEPNA